MSQPEMPTEAYDLLVERVYAPVFLTKLANDYNIVPRTAEERETLLELAGLLADEEHEKKAGDSSLILEAADGLRAALGQRGRQVGPTSHERQVKAAAAQVAQDPAFQQAALQYGQYLYQLQQSAQQG